MNRILEILVGKREATPVPVRMIGFSSDGGLLPSGVTATTALGLSAVWRSLDVIATGVSQLEWREHRGNLELPPSRIVRRPSADYTRREWTILVTNTVALYDVCYLLKVGGYDSEGVPMGLWPLAPQLVTPVYTDEYLLVPPTDYFVGQRRVTIDDLVILRRAPQPGISDVMGGILRLARASFAGAIAAGNYASRYWQAGGAPTTLLETDANLTDPQATEIGDRYAQKRGRGPDHPVVLSGGVHAKPFGADPTTQSATEARNEIVADVGRYFGIPTRILNAPSGDSETYKTAQEANLDLVRYTHRNYIGAIEDAVTDLLPGGRQMSMIVSPLTEGTQLARAQSYQLALAGKPWMTEEEVREAEGLPPQEGPGSLPNVAVDTGAPTTVPPIPGGIGPYMNVTGQGIGTGPGSGGSNG